VAAACCCALSSSSLGTTSSPSSPMPATARSTAARPFGPMICASIGLAVAWRNSSWRDRSVSRWMATFTPLTLIALLAGQHARGVRQHDHVEEARQEPLKHVAVDVGGDRLQDLRGVAHEHREARRRAPGTARSVSGQVLRDGRQLVGDVAELLVGRQQLGRVGVRLEEVDRLLRCFAAHRVGRDPPALPRIHVSPSSSGERRSVLTTTCGPEAIDRLFTSARSVALQTSWMSLRISGNPLPTGVPGTFSNDVMK
jgi:hypothetical protein